MNMLPPELPPLEPRARSGQREMVAWFAHCGWSRARIAALFSDPEDEPVPLALLERLFGAELMFGEHMARVDAREFAGEPVRFETLRADLTWLALRAARTVNFALVRPGEPDDHDSDGGGRGERGDGTPGL